jgi:hypothetical protein
MYNYYSIRISLEFNNAHMYPDQEAFQVERRSEEGFTPPICSGKIMVF